MWRAHPEIGQYQPRKRRALMGRLVKEQRVYPTPILASSVVVFLLLSFVETRF